MADQLELKRIGRQHQAGSDSLLTGMAFFRMKEVPATQAASEMMAALASCHYLDVENQRSLSFPSAFL